MSIKVHSCIVGQCLQHVPEFGMAQARQRGP